MGLKMQTKSEITDMVVLHSCTNNCFGIKNNSGGCCTLGKRDYIIGPIRDSDSFLERYRENISAEASYDDIFIGHEEGRKLFPDLETWQKPASYPALRVNTDIDGYPCSFLGEDKLCTVHEIRSETCRNFSCQHVKDVLSMMSLDGAE